jgi:hypothetical protein
MSKIAVKVSILAITTRRSIVSDPSARREEYSGSEVVVGGVSSSEDIFGVNFVFLKQGHP